MAADTEAVARIRAEMAECLAEEVGLWKAKSRAEAARDLKIHKGRKLLEKEYKGAVYNLVVDELADDEYMLTILIDIQPDDPEQIGLISVPRERVSGGWTDEEMGMMSEIIFLRT